MKEYPQNQLCLNATLLRHLLLLMVSTYDHVQIRVLGLMLLVPPKVLPPMYEKKVGRPRKSRRKLPHEVQEKEGSKMTRHGVEMYCSHCKESGHNITGCSLKRVRLTPKQLLKRKATPAQTDNAEDHVLIQVLAYLPPFLVSCYPNLSLHLFSIL